MGAIRGRVGGDHDLDVTRRVVELEEVLDAPLDHVLLVVGGDDDRHRGQDVLPGTDNSQSPKMDAKTQRAMSHPRRTEIFGLLTQRKGGTSEDELAAKFGMGIRLVEYHVKVLHDADLIARLDERGPGDAGHSYVAASSL